MQQPKYNLSIKFVCNKCGKQFTGQDNLQRHILLKHENNWQQIKYCENYEQKAVKYHCAFNVANNLQDRVV